MDKNPTNEFLVVSTLILTCIVILMPSFSRGSGLTFISDMISNSAPSVEADHTIKFTLDQTIPASGQLRVILDPSFFTIPASLDYTDIDFKIANANKSLFTDPGNGAGTAIGVNVTSGTSGSINFTLNDTDAINAGSAITILIGHNATFGATGDQRIQNPSNPVSYRITVQTMNSSSALIDSAITMIAIIDPINQPVDTTTGSTSPTPTPTETPTPSPTTSSTSTPSPTSGGGDTIFIYPTPSASPSLAPGQSPTTSMINPVCSIKADLNNDCRVDFKDLSILMFWRQRPLTASAKRDIDGNLWPDGKIDLRDFSVLAYYWTD